MLVRITEYLTIDLEKEMWVCHRCGKELISAEKSYKRGCKVHERELREIYQPLIEEGSYSYAPDPDYCRLIEYYCSGCGTMIETEYLPPGHPITEDIKLDLQKMKAKYQGGVS